VLGAEMVFIIAGVTVAAAIGHWRTAGTGPVQQSEAEATPRRSTQATKSSAPVIGQRPSGDSPPDEGSGV
jgi:hypothetical protein